MAPLIHHVLLAVADWIRLGFGLDSESSLNTEPEPIFNWGRYGFVFRHGHFRLGLFRVVHDSTFFLRTKLLIQQTSLAKERSRVEIGEP